MVQVNDILQFTVIGDLQDQEILNVFTYQVNNIDAVNNNLEAITQKWFIEFDTNILSNFSVNMVYNAVRTLNLTDQIDFYEGSVNASGDQPGTPLPVHDTCSIKLIRQTRLTRNGRKSFSGLTEENTANGNILFGQATVDMMELWLGQPVALDLDDDGQFNFIMTPVIVGRTLDGNGVYQLDLAKINNVIGANMNTRVRTQNTRKR